MVAIPNQPSNPQKAVQEAKPFAENMVASGSIDSSKPVQLASHENALHPTTTPSVKGQQQIQTQRT